MQQRKEITIDFKKGFELLAGAEEKYGFFETWHEGMPLWLYGRDRALNIVSGITSYSGQTISSHKIRPLNLIARAWHFLANVHKMWGNDLIIFTNERHLEKELSTGKYYNPFAELAIREYREAKKVLVFEFPIPMTQKYRSAVYPRYLPLDFFFFLRQIFSPLAFFYYPRTKKVFAPKLKASGLFTENEITELVRRCYRSAYFITCYRIFLKLVKWLNPRAVAIYSCMGGFDKFPGVIEIQPALITDIHSVYMYPQTPEIKQYLQTRRMVVFSQETKELLARHGYLRENMIVRQNPKIQYYFIKNIHPELLEKIPAPPYELVIVGNWGGSLLGIIKQIVLDIEKNKEVFKDWNISLVLHPAEENTYKQLKLQKVVVFENHKVSLWGKLARAAATIDIGSTVIQESSYFGCYNIILKDEKFESQKDFIDSLCRGYSYKNLVVPQEFIVWFKANEQQLKSHIIEKNKIIKANHHTWQQQNKT